MLINDAALGEKFGVNKDTIRYICSSQYKGVRCVINDPEDVQLIRELRAEAQALKSEAMRHNPTRLAREYGIGLSTVFHLAENRTYRNG